VKRKYMMFGLLALAIFVLLFALAAPASASTAKKVSFTETSYMWPSSTTGHPEDPSSWIFSKWWTDSKGVEHIRGFMMEGPMTVVPACPGPKLDFPPTAYAYDSVNIDGNYTRETMTSYQGAATDADVKAGKYCGIWKVFAVSYSPDGITSYYSCDSYGVAGVVKGFVMHFHCSVAQDAAGLSVGTGSGWYIPR
jgi:hypothetical protein